MIGVLIVDDHPDELFAAIRAVAAGRLGAAPASAKAFSMASAQLETADPPVLGMLSERVPPAEISEVLGLSQQELESRTRDILARLVGPTRRTG